MYKVTGVQLYFIVSGGTCVACTLPARHAPLPHTPSAIHAPHYACPPAMHTPTTHAPCHACPPNTHAPCHTCPPATHAPCQTSPCMHAPLPHTPPVNRMTDRQV